MELGVNGQHFYLPDFPARNLPHVLHSHQEPSIMLETVSVPAAAAAGLHEPRKPWPCPLYIEGGHCREIYSSHERWHLTPTRILKTNPPTQASKLINLPQLQSVFKILPLF